MAKYAYRPKDNRTPVSHPLFGGLEYGDVVDSNTNPGDDFEAVKAPAKKKPAKPAVAKSTATDVKPAATQPGAGKTGGK